jgi:hypothetical protein
VPERDYSGTPLAKNLGAKPGAEVAVFFTTRRVELEERLPGLRATLAPPSRDKRSGQVSSRADLELAVHVREVDLDRLHCDEERLRDLLVAHLLGGHLRDPALARRQRLEPRQEDLARTGASCRQLVVRALEQGARAAPESEIDALAQPCPRFPAAVRPAKSGCNGCHGSGGGLPTHQRR